MLFSKGDVFINTWDVSQIVVSQEKHKKCEIFVWIGSTSVERLKKLDIILTLFCKPWILEFLFSVSTFCFLNSSNFTHFNY